MATMDRTRNAVTSALLLAVLALGVSGCGQSTPAICSDADQLRTSVQGLKDIKLQRGAVAELSSQFKTIETDLKRLKAEASKTYASQISALRTAGDNLKAGLEAATSNPSVTTVAALQPVVTALTTAVTDLHDALKDSC
jgi:septal ring factor EnvC (AmiA/AmiB activator)